MSIPQLVSQLGLLLERKDNPYDGVIAVAGLWGRLIRHCQADLLTGVDEIVRASLAVAHLEDKEERKKALSSLEETMSRVSTSARFLYTTFQDTRKRLLGLAQFWNVEEYPESDLGVPHPLSKLDTADLVSQLHEGGDHWVDDLRGLASRGRGLVAEFSRAGLHEDLPAEERVALVTQGLRFQHEIGRVVFARLHGLFRRVDELAEREMKHRLSWESPWEKDPDVGNREDI